MFNRMRPGDWRNSIAGEVFLTVGTGFLAFTPGSPARGFVTVALFVIAAAGLLLDVLGRILVRRAARGGRLKGRHSVTDHHLDT